MKRLLILICCCIFIAACKTGKSSYFVRNKISDNKKEVALTNVMNEEMYYSCNDYEAAIQALGEIDSEFKIKSVQFLIAESNYRLGKFVEADIYYSYLYKLKPEEVKRPKLRKICFHACIRKGDMMYKKGEPSAFYYYKQAVKFHHDPHFRSEFSKEIVALRKVFDGK